MTSGLMKTCNVETTELLPRQLIAGILGRMRQDPFIFREN